MKKDSITFQLLVLALTGICALVACTAKPNHKVGESIQGTYAVHFGKDSALIGYLTLNSGQYSFEPNTPSAKYLESADSRFFFISHLQGAYFIEYQGSIDANSILENLDDDEILAMILFNEASTEPQTRGVNRMFLIRNNQKGESLYFHSMVSELQLWGIGKSWENRTE